MGKDKILIIFRLARQILRVKTASGCLKVDTVERGDGSYDSTNLFLYIRQLL
jgi:hypothetical protein